MSLTAKTFALIIQGHEWQYTQAKSEYDRAQNWTFKQMALHDIRRLESDLTVLYLERDLAAAGAA